MGNDEKIPHLVSATPARTMVQRAVPEDPSTVIVYHLSDSTGVTAETLGNSLTAQFPDITFSGRTIPFINSEEHARAIVTEIDKVVDGGQTVLVLCTAINPKIRNILTTTHGIVVDLITSNIEKLERELHASALYATGRAHGQGNATIYQQRMRAIEYAIEHDDAQSLRNLQAAQVILIGPSRCGKTPTSMYLALQHGVFVANYPLLEEDYETPGVPPPLRGFEKRCVGITTTPLRLSQVRTERRPGSTYASLEQCTFEIRQAENLYRSQRIPFLSSATTSVEEMSAIILHTLHIPGILDTALGSTPPHPIMQR